MWSSHATKRPVAYQGLHGRTKRTAALIHTNGGGTDHGSLFGWWSAGARGDHGRDNLHVGAHFQVMTNGHAEQYCLTPENRVLTADLQWVPLGSLLVGDELVGFDEHGPNRSYRRAIVQSVTFAREPVWAVVLENEQVIYATGEHRWLVRGTQGLRWRQTHVRYDTRPQSIQGGNVPQLFTPWSTPTDYDSGWLAGLFDGEGTLNAHGLSFAQNAGPVLDQAVDLLKHRGAEFSVHPNGDCQTVHINGGLRERLAFLGSTRPERLLRKVDPDAFGRLYSGDAPSALRVVAVYPAGEREIAKVATSTGTYIAEGFPMHNCDTDLVIYHAYSASEWAVGFEVEDDGDPSRPMTTAQMTTIETILRELHVPGKILTSAQPGDGVGWHEQFPSWNQSGHHCPGPVREAQVRSGIVPALQTPPLSVPTWWHRTLVCGSVGVDVLACKRRMGRLGYGGISSSLSFGPALENAVKVFQSRHHLLATGIVDRPTAHAIRIA